MSEKHDVQFMEEFCYVQVLHPKKHSLQLPIIKLILIILYINIKYLMIY